MELLGNIAKWFLAYFVGFVHLHLIQSILQCIQATHFYQSNIGCHDYKIWPTINCQIIHCNCDDSDVDCSVVSSKTKTEIREHHHLPLDAVKFRPTFIKTSKNTK